MRSVFIALLIGALFPMPATASSSRLVNIATDYNDHKTVIPIEGAKEYCEKRKREAVCQPSNQLGRGVRVTEVELQLRWSTAWRGFRFKDESFDLWKDATAAGDCEDFVLYFRKKMIEELGWTADVLIVAIVKDTETKAGHAVLVVRARDRDYVLSPNRHEKDIMTVPEAKKRNWEWISRQSIRDPRIWVAMH